MIFGVSLKITSVTDNFPNNYHYIYNNLNSSADDFGLNKGRQLIYAGNLWISVVFDFPVS